MENPKYFREYLLSATLGLAFGCGAVIFLNSQEKNNADLAGKGSQNSSNTQTNSASLRSQASEALKLAEKADPQTAEKFLEYWLGLHPDDRDYIIGQLGQDFFSDGDKYYDFIRDFTLALYQADRTLALSTVAVFPREERIRTLERHILNDWVSDKPETLYENFLTNANENLAINESQLFQLAAIYSNERLEEFEDYYKWMASLGEKGTGAGHMQRSAYEAMSNHVPAEFREELFHDLMNRSLTDHRFRSFPALLIGNHAKESPEEAVTWLDGMEPGPWKDEALFRLLGTTGESHARIGADLMNRESFMEEFAVAWTEHEDGTVELAPADISLEKRQAFYDSSLEYFLDTALSHDPELVYESAEAFYNPELKENFQFAANIAIRQNEEKKKKSDSEH